MLVAVGRYMWCSPTRRSFITGRFLTSITGEQAGTHTNLTPLQFSILPEKLKAANFESRKIVMLSRFVAVRLANPKSITISDFLGKGHMGWQTTDHLLVNRGFESHMGYLGGSESYKWGRMDQSLDPNPLSGKHDMWHDHGPGTDIAPLIGYSTSFCARNSLSPFRPLPGG